MVCGAIELERWLQSVKETNTNKTPGGSACPNERLRSEREKRGWTRDYVAEKIGSETQSIGRWERGATSPSPYYRQRLCELFCMNAEELGFFKEEVKDGPELRILREEQPVEHTNAETEHDVPPIHNARPPYIVLGYRDLLGFVVTGMIVVVVSAILFATFTFSFTSRSPSGFMQIRPGGAWLIPVNGSIAHDTIRFAAKAYPTHAGDPPVNHVNFTVGWNGAWRIGCAAYPPTNDNVFACITNLLPFNAPAGWIRISFDVYDQAGNVNLAPNGVHTVLYEP